MGKILLIKGISKYDAMRNYIDEYSKGLQEEGYKTIVLDTKETDIVEQIINCIRDNDIKVVITCNGILLTPPAINDLFEANNIIQCTIFYDHPIYHLERLAGANKNTIVITCDRKHMKFLNKYFHNINHTGFLPLSGSYIEDIIPYGERKIDLLFTGSYDDKEETLKKLQALPSAYYSVALKMIEDMIATPSKTIEESLRSVLNALKFKTNDADFLSMLVILGLVDTYVRRYYREEIVRTIVDSGIPIQIYGNGWENFPCKHKENLILNNGHGNESLITLANTKISLNIMPWFRDGFQERIASAMLCGAVSLTDSSDYIEENFKDGENIALFSLKELDKLPSIIMRLLNEPSYAQQIAHNGYLEAKKNHTWQNRIKDMIQIINNFM